MPMEPLRQEMKRLCETAPEWDGRVCVLQVTDTSEKAMQLRGLASSLDSSRNWDLRCKVREGLIEFMQRHYPQYLPQLRADVTGVAGHAGNIGQHSGAVNQEQGSPGSAERYPGAVPDAPPG
jgi:hypothetical protein